MNDHVAGGEGHGYDVCVITTIHKDFDNRVYHRQVRALIDSGLRVCVVAPWDFGKRGRDDYGFVATSFPATRPDRIIHGLRTFRAARSVRAKIYIFHDNDFLPWAWILHKMGRKVVYDAHENIPEDILYGKDWIPTFLRKPTSSIFRRIENFVVRSLGESIVAAPSLYRRFTSVGARSRLVRNYPDFKSVPENFALDRAVLYIGDMTPDYGVYNILGIAREIARRGLNLPVRIVDRFPDPALRASVMKIIAAEGLSFEIHAAVPHDQLTSLLRKGCIGISPSQDVPNKAMGAPTKLFEYLMFGLCVVASDIAGTREALDDGGLGILLPPGDHAAWVDSFETLLSDPALAEGYRRRGREAVLTRFNWEDEKRVLTHYVHELVNQNR